MSLHTLATHMAQTGRGPDSMLVHMSPREVESLQALAKAHGGSLTINPHTGLPEAGFLDSLLPMLAGFALDAFVPGLGEAIGGAFGASAAVGTGIAVGGLDALATGSLSKGLMAGFGAYGGAGLSQSLAAAGVSQAGVDQLIKDKALEAGTEATPAVTTNVAPQLTTSTSAPLPGQAGFDAAGNVNTLSDAGRWGSEGLSASTAPTSTPWMNGPESMTGPSGAPDTPFDPSTATLRASYQGIDPRLQGIKNLTANEGWGKFAAENWKPLASAGVSALLSAPQPTVKAPSSSANLGGFHTGYYDPYSGKYVDTGGYIPYKDWGDKNIRDYTHAKKGGLMSLCGGGAVAFAQGGDVNPDNIAAIEAALAAAQGKSDAERNAARDQLLTTYDPATLAQAPSLSQYGGAEQYATAAEEARQRMAAAQANTSTPSVPDYNAAPNAAPSATPQITAEQRSFIDWQQAQPNPYGPGTLADVYKSQGITDPYNDPRVIAQANAQLERAQNRQDLYASSGVTAPTDEISPWQDPNWKNYLGTNKEAYTIGMQAKSDPAAYKALKAQNGWDDATAQSWILKSTDPKAWGVQAAADSAKAGLVAGPGNGPNTPTSSPSATPTPSGSQPSDALRAQATQQLLKDTGAYAIVGAPAPGSSGLAYTGQPPSQDVVDQAWAKYYATLGSASTDKPSGIQTVAPNAAASTNAPASGIQQLTKDGHLVDPTTGHLLNPTLTSAQLSEAKNNMPEMQSAYQAYWNTVQPGDILDFAGGTLTRNPDGTATHTYTDASGKQRTYTFSQSTDFATVAKSDPNIAAEWKSMFNYVPASGTGGTGTVVQNPTGWTPPTAPPTRVPTSIEDFNNRFNHLTGDSKATYDYLMGKGPMPKRAADKGPIMKPYWEAVGGKAPVYQPIKPTTTPDEGKEWTYDAPSNTWKQTPIVASANGGLMGYAAGGLGSLGGYSDGGSLLKGPGDGVSDSIPASIGNHQPARLADGEFVVPARIVSELGNGSTEAGARRLYQMMDRVQNARKKSVGKGKVATDSRAEQYLPA